jgi:lipopolysaccharide/colanic/teichoic acid biosynthesis glycosyltransferase
MEQKSRLSQPMRGSCSAVTIGLSMSIDAELTVPSFFRGRERYHYANAIKRPTHWSPVFRIYKATFDIILSILMLPVIGLVAVVLFILNPWFNPGPLFFVQDRLGWHKNVFRMIKFRTMTECSSKVRCVGDAVELHRITRLGCILRKMRIDELPNFVNVLRGEMSIIGPRPDAKSHAEHFLTKIPHYSFRYLVKPGITGLAQIESGYAEGIEATEVKAHYDQLYVETSCGRLDVYIAWRTVMVMLTGFGAK